MTERADFYILPDTQTLPFTCRLTDKAFQEKHRIHIHLTNDSEANQLNDLLWTFRDISFIPHKLATTGGQANTPVTISFSDNDLDFSADTLFLIDAPLPKTFQKFERLALIVSNDEHQKALARRYYKELKTQGIAVHVHNI